MTRKNWLRALGVVLALVNLATLIHAALAGRWFGIVCAGLALGFIGNSLWIMRPRTVRIRFHWRGWPEWCEECGAWNVFGWIRNWIWPGWWRDKDSGLWCVWNWSLWWGPFHVWSEVPSDQRLDRFAEFNAREKARRER